MSSYVDFDDENYDTTDITQTPETNMNKQDKNEKQVSQDVSLNVVNVDNVYEYHDAIATSDNSDEKIKSYKKFVENLDPQSWINILNKNKDASHQVSKDMYDKLMNNLKHIPNEAIEKMNVNIL